MSKSLGNFEPLVDLLDRHDPQAIRLAFLTTGYSKVMNFTDESLAASYVTLERLKKTYRSVVALADAAADSSGLIARIEAALDEDMNTSVAIAELLQWSPMPGGRAEFERALAGGAHRRELAAYLGAAEYSTLSQTKAGCTSRSVRCRRIFSSDCMRSSVMNRRSTAQPTKKRSLR